jgi:hypothetical protein
MYEQYLETYNEGGTSTLAWAFLGICEERVTARDTFPGDQTASRAGD